LRPDWFILRERWPAPDQENEPVPFSSAYQGFDLFPTVSPSWVPKATVIVGDPGSQYGGWGALLRQYLGTDDFDEFDAAGALGRARLINPKYIFTVIKRPGNTYAVKSILFECTVQDLYDFSYEDVDAASCAAAVQISYGKGNNGRNEGIIYRDTINIRYTYMYPFEQPPW
jgi:hypothetical protein